jgi:aerobic carbon-monoxide dehydrogenase medium subunit
VKPPPFEYADPRSLPEALQTLSRHGEDAKILAGGQSLVPLLNMRLAQPQVLVDLNRVDELAYIRPQSMDGKQGIAVGAMTRQASLEREAQGRQDIRMLGEAIERVGHPQIRNRGTVGGSIAHADPASELPVVFRALDGVATICSRKETRMVPAAEFFLYTFTTSIKPDELLSEVWLPLAAPRTGQAFLEVARRHGDFALVAAAASVTLTDEGDCANVRIAVGGAAPVPVRASRAEASLIGARPTLELFREAGRLAAEEMHPTSDVHADATYRREVAGTLAFRALKIAWERIPRGAAG